MSKSLILLGTLLLASCVQPEPRDTPSQGLIRAYTALNNQDSVGYIRCLTRDKRGVYQALPDALHALLENYKGQHAEVSVVSVTKDDSTATVVYNLTTTGHAMQQQDSLVARMYLADGWQLGY
jgi:hypothetical protein